MKGSKMKRGWRGRLMAVVLAGLAAVAAPVAALDLQGHRGARGLAPENSLHGFEVALRHGVTTLELDVVITRDGVVVIHHDLALNPATTRDAQGRWLDQPGAPIHNLSWQELQAYDVGRIKPGTTYARNHPDQVAVDGTRIPRLSDLFDLVKRQGHDGVRFAIETKINPNRPDATPAPDDFARIVLDEIRRAGMLGRVQIQSFDWRSLQAVQRLAPAVPTVYLSAQQRWLDNIQAAGRQASPWTAGLAHHDHGSVPAMVKAAGGRFWSAFHGDLDAAQVKMAKDLGLQVLVWTVNDPALMRHLLDLGVDGLITDRPDLAQQVLRERGITPR